MSYSGQPRLVKPIAVTAEEAAILYPTHPSTVHPGSPHPDSSHIKDIELKKTFLQYGRFSPFMIYGTAIIFLMINVTPMNILTIVMLAMVAIFVKMGKIMSGKSNFNKRPADPNTSYGCSLTLSPPDKTGTTKGMPSGHTATAVMAALMWGWYAYMTHRQTNFKYAYLCTGIILLIMAVYVSYSRHKVKCHTSTQIVMGWVLAVVIFVAMIIVLKVTSLGDKYFSDILF